MNKKILMAVANHYTSPFQVGSHHFARAFEKSGYEVLFISNPISFIHKIFVETDEFKERKRIYKVGGEKIDNITYYVPYSFFVPRNNFFLSSKFVLNNWHSFSNPKILNYIKQKNFNNVEILWFDSSMYEFLLDKVTFKRSILRIADYSKAFQAVSQNQFEKELEIANRVDKVIFSAKNIKNKYSKIKDQSKMKYVSNGIDIDFFKNADKTFPNEYRNIAAPIVVYIGSISEWFDVDLIYQAAQTLKSYNFVLIGPVQKNLSKIENLNNVFVLGSKPNFRIAQFLYNAHVGIIPFDIKKNIHLVESVNPIKLFEYLACELPVVSMSWHQIKTMKSPAILCSTNEEFILNIEKATTRQKEHNMSFLSKNSWENQLKIILEHLNV